MQFMRFTVRARLYLGFAALVAISLGLVVFSIYQLSGVGTNVGTMDALAGNTQRVLTMTRQLEAIRRAETRFLLDASEQAMKDARESARQTDGLLTEATQATLSAERKKTYGSVQETLHAFLNQLDQFGQLSASWVSERAKLFSGGDALTAATDQLTAASRAWNNDTAGDAADAIERTCLLVRLANWRFMATENEGGVATFNTNVANARAALTKLQQIAPPEIMQLITPVQTELSAYEASFTAYSKAKLATQRLFSDQMRPEILAMQGQLDGAAKSLADNFQASRATAFATISSASHLQEIMAAVAVLVGIGLAFLIGRGIVRPLTAMTSVMGQLASGDHSVDVPARDSQDEIGEIARWRCSNSKRSRPNALQRNRGRHRRRRNGARLQWSGTPRTSVPRSPASWPRWPRQRRACDVRPSQ